jgi:hypothetical protein
MSINETNFELSKKLGLADRPGFFEHVFLPSVKRGNEEMKVRGINFIRYEEKTGTEFAWEMPNLKEPWMILSDKHNSIIVRHSDDYISYQEDITPELLQILIARSVDIITERAKKEGNSTFLGKLKSILSYRGNLEPVNVYLIEPTDRTREAFSKMADDIGVQIRQPYPSPWEAPATF